MRTINLAKLIGSGESMTVEWKQTLAEMKEIIETVTAFVNTEGGKIFVGVKDFDNIAGVQIGKGSLEELANKIAQHTEPKIQPRISIKRIEDRSIVVIDVKPSGGKLVLADGRPYKRVGSSTRQMGKEEYERLILEKHKSMIQFDAQVCNGATITDIDKKKIDWFLEKREQIRKIKKPTGMPYQNLLVSIGAALKTENKMVPTNAGILFFGINPKRFFIQSQLRLVKFKGDLVTRQVIDRADLAAPLCDMVDDAEDFIRKDIRLLSFRTDKSFMREDKFEYPIQALREAVTNALIHRDYRELADSRVFIFDNRVEVINPGTFPNGVTPVKPIHKPVNLILSSLMYDVGYIEKYGSGIYAMNELCGKWGIHKPQYHLHPIETKLIFKSRIKDTTIIELGDGAGPILNERQKRALEHIFQKKMITKKEYVAITHISGRQANKDIKDLLIKNLIVRSGEGRGVKYRVRD
ncbi:MAG: putative DNA binding domain-containing protein [Candidatus Omnitrophica bacterium]|nr:putative DNA binding domain-containing protein [Candidatus Omnitrophota bacterium]